MQYCPCAIDDPSAQRGTMLLATTAGVAVHGSGMHVSVAGDSVPNEHCSVATDGEYPTSHCGAHVNPLGSCWIAPHTPLGLTLAIPPGGAQGLGAHENTAGVNAPPLHVTLGLVGVYPSAHCVVHTAPLASGDGSRHGPVAAAFATAGTAQGRPMQVKFLGENTPNEHASENTSGSNPAAHRVVHDAPDGMVDSEHDDVGLTLGIPVGGGHEAGMQEKVVGRSAPLSHSSRPVIDGAYPVAHDGVHSCPLANVDPSLHGPRTPALVIPEGAAQEAGKHMKVFGVSVPAEHESWRESGTYPDRHCDVHDCPDGMVLPSRHAPVAATLITPCGGVHGSGAQTAAWGVNWPSEHVSDDGMGA